MNLSAVPSTKCSLSTETVEFESRRLTRSVSLTQWLHFMQGVRQELYDHLTRINPDKNWRFIIDQIGMFS